MRLDPLTSVTIVEAELHSKVHYGELFDIDFIDETWLSAEVHNFAIFPGSRPPHVRFGVAAGGNAKVELYENPVFSNDGTPQTLINRNRLSSNELETGINFAPTVTNDGMRIHANVVPGGAGGNASGGQLDAFQEFVLNPDRQYLLRVTNLSGVTVPVSVEIQLYEHIRDA